MSFSNINIQNFILENELMVGESMLDVGAGHGALAYLMARSQKYGDVKKIAVEISSSAEEFNSKHKLYDDFLSFDSDKIEQRRYDTVFALEILEHLIPKDKIVKLFLEKLESLAKKRVIISVPAPYMTYNRESMKEKLESIKGMKSISDDETIEVFADLHKQIIYPEELMLYGYKPAFNMRVKTISGSIVFYKDVDNNSNNTYSLFELLDIKDYLTVGKKFYCNDTKIDNKYFLIQFIKTLLKTTKVFYFNPLIPALIYNLKVYIARMFTR